GQIDRAPPVLYCPRPAQALSGSAWKAPPGASIPFAAPYGLCTASFQAVFNHDAENQMTDHLSQPDDAWAPPRPTALLVLADGTVIEGKGIGATGETVAEVCFNTALTGYQEI